MIFKSYIYEIEQSYVHEIKRSIFKHSDYIRWMAQTMKFHIAKPSSLPILIPLGLRVLLSNIHSLCSSLKSSKFNHSVNICRIVLWNSPLWNFRYSPFLSPLFEIFSLLSFSQNFLAHSFKSIKSINITYTLQMSECFVCIFFSWEALFPSPFKIEHLWDEPDVNYDTVPIF